ncbi:MAG: hypothetical protein WA975_11150 [Mesorhizobium sp.]
MRPSLVLAVAALPALVAATGFEGIGFPAVARVEGLLGSAPPPARQDNLPAPPPAPGSPGAAIKPFYEHYGLELDPAERNRFTDPARTVLDKNDVLRKSGQGDCLDPNMALDNAVADKAEIGRTLRMLEAVEGDQARVVVAFVEAGAPHRLEWKLKRVGGDWKIADLLSVTGEWALSQYQCE